MIVFLDWIWWDRGSSRGRWLRDFVMERRGGKVNLLASEDLCGGD